MGVVYKLIPEISSFIIEQKQSNPRLTCQGLAGLVQSHFSRQVSKSSVHALLKQSHIITPRHHQQKNKFQIPPEKKAQIFQTVTPPMASPKVSGEVRPCMGEIFLKVVFWDLSFKPILGLKDFNDISSLNNNRLRLEWESLTRPIYAIKVELEDSHCFYIDCRFQGLYADNPQKESLAAPLERAAGEMPDYVLNNIKPLIIREFNATDLMATIYDFIAAFENLPGKAVTKVFLIGAQNQTLTEFSLPLAYKRRFILGISSNCKEFQWVMENPQPETSWVTPLKDGSTSSPQGKTGQSVALRVLKKEGKIVITNLESNSYNDIIRLYLERHPDPTKAGEGSQNEILQSAYSFPQDDNSITDQPPWLKNRLKERALMFFPSDLPSAALEEILALPGFEAYDEKMLAVHLNVPDQFPYIQSVQAAARCVNSLYIIDTTGRKIDVQVDT